METPGTILSSLKLILSQESKAEAIHFQRMTKTSRATIKDLKDKGVAIPITSLRTHSFGYSKGQMGHEELLCIMANLIRCGNDEHSYSSISYLCWQGQYLSSCHSLPPGLYLSISLSNMRVYIHIV